MVCDHNRQGRIVEEVSIGTFYRSSSRSIVAMMCILLRPLAEMIARIFQGLAHGAIDG
jgi:hypothetical protein